MSGCQPDKELSAYVTALQQVKDLIDQNRFTSKYVILYEVKSDDLGSIYKIRPADSPIEEGSLERPVEVIKYGGKFICFISPTAQSEISHKKLSELTSFENDDTSDSFLYKDVWYLGVSKDGRKHSLAFYTEADARAFSLYTYVFPKLWEFLSEEYSEANPPRFALGQYILTVDDVDKSKESLQEHLESFRGFIYYSNSEDEYFMEEKKKSNKPFFAVLNGKDTLELVINDKSEQHLYFESVSKPLFFKVLPMKDTWHSLYDLIRDSTFYFQYTDGKYVRFPVLFGNNFWSFGVEDDDARVGYSICKEGVNEVLKDNGSFNKWRGSE